MRMVTILKSRSRRADSGRALSALLATTTALATLHQAATPARGQCDPQELAKLLASDAAVDDRFGVGVAVSGDTVVVGANFDDHAGGSNAGSAYVFVLSGGLWTEQAKLTASDAAASDLFGNSVAVSGDTAVVGARMDNHAGGADAGSAYVFLRAGGVWTQQAKLTASDAAAGDQFGVGVAVSGDTAVVAAYHDDHAGWSDAGSAYVFLRTGTVWAEQAKLTSSTAAAGDEFGIRLAIEGDTVVIGENGDAGPAWVFVKPDGGWANMTETAALTASDAAAGDIFGIRVAVSGDTVLVGSNRDDNAGGVDAGAAYVYERPVGGWTNMTETAKLTASDAAAGDIFGSSVAVSGDTALVSATLDTHAGGTSAGAAYIFCRTGPGALGWTERAKLTASDAAANDQFGIFIALSGDTAVIGSHMDDNAAGTAAGSAYVFDVAMMDCNNNCVCDSDEIAGGTSQDCNSNGTPDECEGPDCNSNGTPDACEIAGGTSQDCNSNGTPDECEQPDCNSNGIPDTCDIAAGTSQDANGDGTPDECPCLPQGVGPEACCLPNGACQALEPYCCLAAGGAPRGTGTTCAGDADLDGKDDLCVPPCPVIRLYGTLINGTLPSGDESYTFAEVSTVDGHVTPLFDFSLPPAVGISAMAFNPDSCKFVVVSPAAGGQVIEIDAELETVGAPQPITGLLPAGPGPHVVGLEYDPTQAPGERVLITYGRDANHNLQNRIASLNPVDGVVSNFTAQPLAVDDADLLVFNPDTAQLIITDTNNIPFKSVSGLFGPSLADYTDGLGGEYDPELYDPACSPDGTMYFSRRATRDLRRLVLDPVNGDHYELVGPHLGTTPTTYAVGLAFAPMPGCCCAPETTGFIENFNSPIAPDDHVFFGGDPIYTKSILSSTGGDRDGNAYSNAFILQNFANIILNDQSGTGFFLFNGTSCSGGVAYTGEVWGTLAPVPVCPNTCYEYSFYLTNRNAPSQAIIEPRINNVAIAAGVTAVGSWEDLNPAHRWQRFSFTWDSGSATTADLSLFNLQSGCIGNDFGIDTIALTPCCDSPAQITSAFSRQVTGDIPINIAGRVENGNVTTDPRQCAITEVHICFDVGPCPLTSNDAVTVLSQTGCPVGSQAAYAPYSGSTMTATLDARCLILSFTPGLPSGRTYKFALGPQLTSVAGQSIELRGLVGDANSDGRVNAIDRSLVVGCWTGPGVGVSADFNCDGVCNAIDRSIAVGAWTNPGANCAP